MTDLWRNALWRQFGAAIDTLDDAVRACPDSLWNEPVWIDHSEHPVPDGYTAFWNIAYHTLFWLDLYLYGTEEGFAPPPPFTLSELDPAGVVPDPPYDRDLLRGYLASIRSKSQVILDGLTDEQAKQPCTFPWGRGKAVSYFELQLYSMRHIQEHAAQLHLFLGQQTAEENDNWVAWARDA